ncbi:g4074 [Coccomyxa viridis]|uniref:G4074 protein n=1 Tax=Coccomyxa viridis TaxID=1274662 RepID=A0ABP1FUE6_9CHLO
MQNWKPGSRLDFMATQEAPMLTHCFEVMQSSAEYTSVTSSSKKGAGVWYFSGSTNAISNARVGWVYDWTSTPYGQRLSIPSGVEFVPQVWGAKDVFYNNLNACKQVGNALLGFHEPELSSGASMSVQTAVSLWYQLQTTGLPLGSPAVASNAATPGSWLDQFMSQVQSKGLRVDFIALHWSGSNFDTSTAVSQLQQYIQDVHARYQRPIWLTQISLGDFGTNEFPTDAQLTSFINAAVPMLEATPYVARYAWFALPPYKALGLSVGSSDGALTPIGRAYAGAGAAPPAAPTPSLPAATPPPVTPPPATPAPVTTPSATPAPSTPPPATTARVPPPPTTPAPLTPPPATTVRVTPPPATPAPVTPPPATPAPITPPPATPSRTPPSTTKAPAGPPPSTATPPTTQSATAVAHAKKGVGTWSFTGEATALRDVNVAWVYDWGVSAGAQGLTIPSGVEFVPMIRDASDVTSSSLAAAKASGKTLLGFNEPNLDTQGNVTVEQAISFWPQLQATGMRLGSPAVSAGAEASWLGPFMAQAAQLNYTVDFIAIHWYSANFGNATAEVQALVEFLQSVYNVWQKPVWLTELCQVNFGATTSLTRFPSYDQQLAFMSAAIPALDTLPFLERYAWYALFPDQLFSNNTAALYDDSGNPTPTGTLYATL